MPLIWLSLAFLGGLILGDWLEASWPVWLAASMAAATLAFVLRRLDRFRISPAPLFVFLLPAAFFGGALRFQLSQPALTPQSLAWYNDRGALAITGVIAAPPDRRDSYTYLRIQVQEIAPLAGVSTTIQTGQKVSGMLLAMALPGEDWRYGDQVRLVGNPVSPPEASDFSFREYLARQGIYTYVAYPQITRLASGQGSPFWAWLYALKDQALQELFRIFPQPESALLAGILLGDDSRLSPGLERAFQVTGTAHIIAISGFNIAILAGLFSTLFSRLLGARWGALAAALGIGFYTLLVGANPAVVRAAIMGFLGLFAAQVGRRQMGLNSLAFTALVMCLVDPNLPWDVSFQLSFMATLGLIIYAQPMQDAFIHLAERRLPSNLARKLAGPVGEYILFTLAAQLVTFPVMAFNFHNFSLVSLLANPLVLPPQPLVMVLGGVALLGSLVHPLLGQGLAYLAWPLTAYTIRVVEWLATIPNGLISLGKTSLVVWVLFYAILFGLTFFGKSLLANWRQVLRKTLTPQAGLVAGAILVILVWSAVGSTPDGLLHLTLFNSGSPGSLLIETPGGRWVLVSGGPTSSQLSQEIGQRLPLFGRQIDALIIAMPKDKDLPGLAFNLDSFPVGQALWVRPTDAGLQQTLDRSGVSTTAALTGQTLDLGGGASLKVIDQTTSGAVLLLSWDSFRALLPVGTVDDLGEILSSAARATGPVSALMLVGSGSPEANPAEVITFLHPQVMIVDPDTSGCYTVECPIVLSLPGYTVLRTDQNGWIEISTDGKQMWVEVEN